MIRNFVKKHKEAKKKKAQAEAPNIKPIKADVVVKNTKIR